MKIGKKSMITLFAVASLIVLSMLTGIKVSKTSSTTKIHVDPPLANALYETDFTVEIKINDVTDLYGWQAWFRWDTKLLDVVDVSEGPFLGSEGWTGWSPIVNETEGWMFLYSLITGRANEVSGSGTLARIRFHAVDVGECTLDLYGTRLINSKPNSVPTPPYLGDANGDLRVDIRDMGQIGGSFGAASGNPRYDPNADFNKDNVVDLYDLLCYGFNYLRQYPGNAAQPVEIAHEAEDGYVNVYSPVSWKVTWKWLDYPDENEVWLEANVTVSIGSPIENFVFNRSSGEISFNFTSTEDGYCSVSVPKLLMDGAFTVRVNDTETASILTWNRTHSFVYFTYDEGPQNVTIIGEIVTRIRSPDLLSIIDVNGDGTVDILDVAAVAVRFKWKEDC